MHTGNGLSRCKFTVHLLCQHLHLESTTTVCKISLHILSTLSQLVCLVNFLYSNILYIIFWTLHLILPVGKSNRSYQRGSTLQLIIQCIPVKKCECPSIRSAIPNCRHHRLHGRECALPVQVSLGQKTRIQ